MLTNLFKEFLDLSAIIRNNYPESLGNKKDNWKEVISLIDTNIPKLYEVVYGSVSGTKRDIREQEMMDFIPGYRLIHIDELFDEKKNLDNVMMDQKSIGYKIVIPLLANYSSDFICYTRMDNGQEKVASLVHDDCQLILMHDSVEKFLETICEFYKEKVYYLDDEGYLDYDFIKEGEVGAKINKGVSYWVE